MVQPFHNTDSLLLLLPRTLCDPGYRSTNGIFLVNLHRLWQDTRSLIREEEGVIHDMDIVLGISLDEPPQALVPLPQDEDMNPLDQKADAGKDPIYPEHDADQDPVYDPYEQLNTARFRFKGEELLVGT